MQKRQDIYTLDGGSQTVTLPQIESKIHSELPSTQDLTKENDLAEKQKP